MVLYDLTIGAVFSVVPALLVSLFRVDHWKGNLKPFFLLLWLGFANDLLSLSLAKAGFHTAINGNCYVLLEFILLWIWYKKLEGNMPNRLIYFILGTGCLIWLLDNCLLHSITVNNSLFRMCSSFLIVFMCFERINQLRLSYQGQTNRTTELFLLAGLLLYHAYKTFLEAFHVFPAHSGRQFFEILWGILDIIGIITNILFTLAFLWLHKRAYILR
jgi:hypothetical protein